MKKILTCIALLTLLTSLTISCNQEEAEASNNDTVPQLVAHIQQCARLDLTQYKIHVITKYEDDGSQLAGNIMGLDFKLKLPTGSRKIAIPIDATVHAYIDFSDFSEDNIIYYGDKVIITLPEPKIELLNTKVDNAGITTGISFLRSKFSDEEITRFQRLGRDSIERQVRKMDFTERARSQAAHTLIPIVKQLGFTDDQIEIKFSKHVSNETLRFLYELENQ